MHAVGGPALVCRALEPIAPHFFTTRAWQLGNRLVDGDRAWNEAAEAIGVDTASLIRVNQVHGAHVHVRRNGSTALADAAAKVDADVIVSDDRSAAVAVRAADCAPIVIADARTGAVAAVHAGWRGLAAGTPRAAVAALAAEFGSRPMDLVAAIGPAIGPCCYEIGGAVRTALEEAGFGPRLHRWCAGSPSPSGRNPSMAGLRAPREDHWYFDGVACARDQLEDAGVPAAHIFAADLCTASHPLVFCSYRRDGTGAGRLAGVIRRPPLRP